MYPCKISTKYIQTKIVLKNAKIHFCYALQISENSPGNHTILIKIQTVSMQWVILGQDQYLPGATSDSHRYNWHCAPLRQPPDQAQLTFIRDSVHLIRCNIVSLALSITWYYQVGRTVICFAISSPPTMRTLPSPLPLEIYLHFRRQHFYYCSRSMIS